MLRIHIWHVDVITSTFECFRWEHGKQTLKVIQQLVDNHREALALGDALGFLDLLFNGRHTKDLHPLNINLICL